MELVSIRADRPGINLQHVRVNDWGSVLLYVEVDDPFQMTSDDANENFPEFGQITIMRPVAAVRYNLTDGEKPSTGWRASLGYNGTLHRVVADHTLTPAIGYDYRIGDVALSSKIGIRYNYFGMSPEIQANGFKGIEYGVSARYSLVLGGRKIGLSGMFDYIENFDGFIEDVPPGVVPGTSKRLILNSTVPITNSIEFTFMYVYARGEVGLDNYQSGHHFVPGFKYTF
ncbi:hypothetical protein GCM10023333_13500 [Ferrimonas pelagia]|uniref:Uncharacterized protein n=2 Tax=Ferrimonas pelagia TaxID=1177826 RepID=A0ABP9EJ07_9GAMM